MKLMNGVYQGLLDDGGIMCVTLEAWNDAVFNAKEQDVPEEEYLSILNDPRMWIPQVGYVTGVFIV